MFDKERLYAQTTKMATNQPGFLYHSLPVPAATQTIQSAVAIRTGATPRCTAHRWLPLTSAAPDNPIGQGVSSPHTAGRYSSHYYTIDGRPIVERAGYGPVVIHKMIGRGHVVLIGHDYFESNPSQDRIVGNAVLYLPFLTDDLWVSPSQGLDFGGNKGGPFTPKSQSYTLTNVGAGDIEWTATITQPFSVP